MTDVLLCCIWRTLLTLSQLGSWGGSESSPFFPFFPPFFFGAMVPESNRRFSSKVRDKSFPLRYFESAMRRSESIASYFYVPESWWRRRIQLTTFYVMYCLWWMPWRFWSRVWTVV